MTYFLWQTILNQNSPQLVINFQSLFSNVSKTTKPWRWKARKDNFACQQYRITLQVVWTIKTHHRCSEILSNHARFYINTRIFQNNSGDWLTYCKIPTQSCLAHITRLSKIFELTIDVVWNAHKLREIIWPPKTSKFAHFCAV